MSLRVIIFLGLVAIALGSAIEHHKKTTKNPLEGSALHVGNTVKPLPLPLIPIRKIRSPQGGSVEVNVKHDDKSGTTGSVSANQNIWSSSDGKTSIDANAGVSKNFDHGNSNTNGGISLTHEW